MMIGEITLFFFLLFFSFPFFSFLVGCVSCKLRWCDSIHVRHIPKEKERQLYIFFFHAYG